MFPNTLTDDGRPRIISLDIMRGLGIFCMMIMHEMNNFDNIITEEGVSTTQTGINKIITYIIGGLTLLFEHFKSFFALISAITMGYLFFYKIEKLRYIQVLKMHLFALMQTSVMTLAWFFFDQIEPTIKA